MIAGAARIGGITDMAIAGAAAAFEVVRNSDAGDALALLRVAVPRLWDCASANGIAHTGKSRSNKMRFEEDAPS